MGWGRIFLGAIGAALLLAGPAAAEPCRATSADLTAQRAAVRTALKAVNARHAADLARLERTMSAEEADRTLAEITDADRAARRAALTPLAGAGYAEAMVRLAFDLRDSSDPQDIRRWFGLVDCAARSGHVEALDELVRWHWHQRGDGSIAAAQRHRAIALAYAEQAADAGSLGSLERIAIYISGDVHQYPADLALGRRLLELCARAGLAGCQEDLATGARYDYGQGPVARYLWLARLAPSNPARFAARRDAAWATLTADEQAQARQDEAAWRPQPWPALKPQWREIRAAILRRGETSLGADTVCATQTPWCRGRWVDAQPFDEPPIADLQAPP